MNDKNKLAAALLAIFLGGLGIHKFYLRKVGMGILYLIFAGRGYPLLSVLLKEFIICVFQTKPLMTNITETK